MTQNLIDEKNTIIGYSALGKALSVEFIGKKDSKFRIFIIAGQHGDEKYSQKAVSNFVNHYKLKSKEYSFCAAILTNANPDGYEKNSRKNAKSIDLNRDHLLLQSTETQAIHSFVKRWLPQVIIDVHNYPSRRTHLLKQNLILNHDIFVDISTNPAILLPINEKQITNFFMKLKSTLDSKGISCERYHIFKKSGKIRPSTIDIQDARNSLALSYDSFCILLEGKEPLKKEGLKGEKKTISSQFQALCGVMDWLEKNKKEFVTSPHFPKKGELVPIHAHYKSFGKTLKMTLKNSKTKKLDEINFKEYFSNVEITKFVELPKGYAVPNSLKYLLKILQKHGFSKKSKTNKEKKTEVYYIKNNLEDNISKKQINKKIISKSLLKYSVFPTEQLGGRFLAILLEPESKYGLQRFPELNLVFSKNSKYPILRIH